MISLVSFSTAVEDAGYPDTELRQFRLERSAYQYAGVRQHDHWTRRKLKRTDFYRENKEVLDLIPGAGYYQWKPYIIGEALSRSAKGDWTVYCDNSLFFVQNAQILFELAEKNNGFGFYAYAGNYSIRNIMQPATRNKLKISEALLDSPATWSGFMILKRNEATEAFINEWLQLCLDPELLVNQKEPCPPGVVHKQDMPLLSYLRSLKGIPGFRIPHQFGDKNKMEPFRTSRDFLLNGVYEEEIFENSPYGTLCKWDKDGIGCRRPLKHYIDPVKISGFIRRRLV